MLLPSGFLLRSELHSSHFLPSCLLHTAKGRLHPHRLVARKELSPLGSSMASIDGRSVPAIPVVEARLQGQACVGVGRMSRRDWSCACAVSSVLAADLAGVDGSS